ncbi:hypothetical protein CY34DRAFT_809280 [Suillus luteus UH-Slu-Lm8-n1]|uniref:Uncharacterized protein n=1 Tax=Suillus luteus UH-Slu-Lm8-n1 TaxID=930992 RepID=A0A0D0A9U2_9AGAM|nr:hypothetical protein CY34DRAFT_809280 [Suillus luteus UH-Slu-Lm8-n1]
MTTYESLKPIFPRDTEMSETVRVSNEPRNQDECGQAASPTVDIKELDIRNRSSSPRFLSSSLLENRLSKTIELRLVNSY